MTIAEHTINSRKIVVGDIHGCSKTFRHLVGETIKLTRKDTLILIGDYIDKGPDSKGTLDFIQELKTDGFEVIGIRGNHEELLINAYHGDKSAELTWLKNGGDKTLECFGVATAYQIPEDYIQMMSRMGYYLEMDEAYIVHAGFNFNIDDPFVDKDAMLNIRGFTPDLNFLNGKKLIHGHTPLTLDDVRQQIIENKPVIDIDAGCVFAHKPGRGYLAAIELGSWKLYETRNIDVAVMI